MIEAFVVDRAFLRIAGADAEKFLQGQLSQDLGQRERALSFLLDPTGKVVALLRVVRHDDCFVLDVDPAAAEAVEARLRRFLLRSKVTIDAVPSLALVRVWGAAPLADRPVSAAWSDAEPVPQDLVTVDVDGELERLSATVLDSAEHERRRILAGVPVSGVDIGPDTIPAETGAWAIEAAVSFTKGCYTGQELVARIDSRGGNVPRPLRVLEVDGAAAGDEVTLGDGPVGVVTSAAAGVALGPVARKVAVGDEVVVGGHPARVLR